MSSSEVDSASAAVSCVQASPCQEQKPQKDEVFVLEDGSKKGDEEEESPAQKGASSLQLRVHLPTCMELSGGGRVRFRRDLAAGGVLLMEEGRVEEAPVEAAAAERARAELRELQRQRDDVS